MSKVTTAEFRLRKHPVGARDGRLVAAHHLAAEICIQQHNVIPAATSAQTANTAVPVAKLVTFQVAVAPVGGTGLAANAPAAVWAVPA